MAADLAPGASATLSVTAPGTVGSYVLDHRMVKEGVAWFDQLQKTRGVTVIGAKANSTERCRLWLKAMSDRFQTIR